MQTVEKPVGKNVFLTATISKTNAFVMSVPIGAVVKETSTSTLDEMCEGIRESLANLTVKSISETDTKETLEKIHAENTYRVARFGGCRVC